MTGKRAITVALAGNPNSGKTSLYNALTGARQSVGNWPGVTVEKKEGRFIYQGHEVTVVDLPGTYALDAYTLDERVAREYLVAEKPDAVVAVVDASNLERNLYLVAQLLELGATVVVALNMVDIAQSRGIEIDTAQLEKVLGVKVVTTVASMGVGIETLKRVVHDIQRAPPPPGLTISYGRDIEAGIEQLVGPIVAAWPGRSSQARWLALKLLEGDPEAVARLGDDEQAARVRETLAVVRARLERRLDLDIETAVVERRYGFLNGVAHECTRHRADLLRRISLTDRIDSVVTNRWVGIPIFLLLMWGTFQLVFRVGAPLSGLIERLFGWLGSVISSGLALVQAPAWLASLLVEGIIGGVGSVLVFVPNIVILFAVIALLEESGYMARAAFVMDRFMHLLGLHGKSFIPMIIGFGCNVPAIMATRTLESRKDRILTVLVNPLMSCSARLPIYILFAGVFFSRHRGLVVFSLYLLGMVLAVLVARLFKWVFFKSESAPLIMEMPPYHLPTLRSILVHMWERAWLFVRKAGTIIALTSVVIWLLASLPWGVEYASEASVIGRLGSLLAPLLRPAGFGYWWVAVSLAAGVVAKEIVIGTMGAIHGAGPGGLADVLRQSFTPLSAYAFMVMSLVYIPCVATIAAIRRETNWKWALLSVGYTLALGWLLAVVIFQVGSLVT
ncbi:ferrous iron transport protein B [candidate division WOR-3 bacterium]|nr:ferrous iron transport protein B [candidate division WOR-3 bacterium]